jgi:hypothetical protein
MDYCFVCYLTLFPPVTLLILCFRFFFLRSESAALCSCLLFSVSIPPHTMGHWSSDGKYTTDCDSEVESGEEVDYPGFASESEEEDFFDDDDGDGDDDDDGDDSDDGGSHENDDGADDSDDGGDDNDAADDEGSSSGDDDDDDDSGTDVGSDDGADPADPPANKRRRTV